MKAITTKFMGPTDFRGSRIRAFTEDQSITVPYEYEGHPEEAHEKAARALMDKMRWQADLLGGGVKGGYVWVMVPETFRRARPSRDRSQTPKKRSKKTATKRRTTSSRGWW